MKFLYVSFININNKERGIEKKVFAQFNTLKSYFAESFLSCFLNDNEFGFWDEKLSTRKILLRKYPFIEIFAFLADVVKSENIDFIYIRYTHFSSPFFILFLKKIKKTNPSIKIYMEIPTYPYDQEYKNASKLAKLIHFVEIIYRKKLKLYINRIVTLSTDENIWGIKCLSISNAVDFESIELVQNVRQVDLIRLTMVSSMHFWHGIDRLIASLRNYLVNNTSGINIVLNIVGRLDVLHAKNLISLVDGDEILKSNVVFLGFKSGKELDLIYNNTDIAVGCLGVHRKGVIQVQSLKNREYAAKGLPFIISHQDKDFLNKAYVFYASSNEDLIDFFEIIDWFESLKYKPVDIRNDVKNLSWQVQMKKVIDELFFESNQIK